MTVHVPRVFLLFRIVIGHKRSHRWQEIHTVEVNYESYLLDSPNKQPRRARSTNRNSHQTCTASQYWIAASLTPALLNTSKKTKSQTKSVPTPQSTTRLEACRPHSFFWCRIIQNAMNSRGSVNLSDGNLSKKATGKSAELFKPEFSVHLAAFGFCTLCHTGG